MDEQAVAETIEEMGALLRSDGADLRLIAADSRTDRIEVALELEGAECAECVLPADLLRQMVADALARRIPREFELVLRDPRV
jgi:Fe-S cluster biogenesis protein NfuA